jgi:hypothetical protein
MNVAVRRATSFIVPRVLSCFSYPKLDPYHRIGPAKYQVDERDSNALVLIGTVLLRPLAY